MTTSTRAALIALLVTGATAIGAQSWLPPGARDQMAAQLAERLTTISKPRDAAGLAQATRRIVAAVGAQLESWTPRGALDRAPTFPMLTLPDATDRHLDAMARYQLCNLVLFRQFESAADAQDRRVGAFGLTAVTLAVVYLMQPFVAGGGSPGRVEAFLTGATMEKVNSAIQEKSELLTHVERQCEPVVGELLSTAF
jgi:hypothetical protein